MKIQLLISGRIGAGSPAFTIINALRAFKDVDLAEAWEGEHRAIRLTVSTADGSEARRTAFADLVRVVASWAMQYPVSAISTTDDGIEPEMPSFTDEAPRSFAVA